MAYIVCQANKCQQTYPIEQFDRNAKNISCGKCGGVLIDKNGYANFSQNSTVIPVISAEEIAENQVRKLREKRKELEQLTKEIRELEKGY